ncbi:hypothetical protein [Caballeronia sordidicola]|uniref:Uncharacterized protein n=1 Tax=Caballeronia sordidicola TaxID=196367 RepID=A0A226X5X0_CABSO|nr:hypothetical protein [Caballeronia sordidicola]OXC78539.1 hypothetical protein BSU04_11330 [Caballeronia sordidicola]
MNTNNSLDYDGADYGLSGEIAAHAGDVARFSTWLLVEPESVIARERLNQAKLLLSVLVDEILDRGDKIPF